MKQSKRDKLIDGIVFAVLLVAVSAMMLTLFYRQTIGSEALYHSDMKAYILEMQGLESAYEFPYPVFFKFAAFIHLFTGPEMAVAIATMLLNAFAMVLVKLAFNYFMLGADGVQGQAAVPGGERGKCFLCGNGWQAGVLVSLLTIALFYVSMLIAPGGIYLPGIYRTYLGVFTPNPFHNATYLAARSFSILAFLWFVKILPVYEQGMCKECGKPGVEFRRALGLRARGQGVSLADYIFFSVFLLLATMTKPSFTLVLVSTAGLIMLYRLIRSGFRNFLSTVQFGLTFIPTFIDLLYQYKGVFMPGDGTEGGVGFTFGEVWIKYCGNLPLAVCLGVGFPLAVLVVNFRKCKKNTMFLFSWQLYAVSFAEAFFLYEKGFRKFDFNFCWGYICGMFFCHFTALIVLVQATREYLIERAAVGSATARSLRLSGNAAENGDGQVAAEEAGKGIGSGETFWRKFWVRTALLVLQWLAFLWHLACGILYFKGIFGGAMYY